MITKRASAVPGRVQVIFELPSCVWADHIYLTGDFNQWHPQSLPLQQGRDGVWRLAIELPSGHTYEFRYLVDGHWITDSHADGVAINPYGTNNSIVDTTLPVASLQVGGKKLRSAPLWWHKCVTHKQLA